MTRLVFSGHESFSCKQFWLKKGFDFLKTSKKFSDKTAVVNLGVGKNMVNAIRFWLQAFGLTEDQNSPSQLGFFLFGETGKDVFLEDIASIWLLHYFLVKEKKASIYNLVFNDFRKTRNEFTKEHLHNFLRQKCESNKSTKYNANTIERDIRVFINSYLKPTRKKSDIEDVYSGLLHEINLLNSIQKEDISKGGKLEWYFFESNLKEDLPYEIILFSILDNPTFENSINFKELLIGENSPGRVFAINSEGLYKKIESMTEKYKDVTFSETAGNQVLQISSKINKWHILNDYYN